MSTTVAIDLSRLERQTSQLSKQFAKAEPFAHLALDGYLLASPSDFSTWPPVDWPEWAQTLDQKYAPKKFTCNDIDAIPNPMLNIIHQMSEPRFLKLLEAITGIPKLIPDPYLTGGGLHFSGPGGTLSPHTDFHHYAGANLYRRINVIIYLNEGWEESDGGCLTLYDRDTEEPIVKIAPHFGRIVAFRTDDRSLHGFPDPIGRDLWRRSIALYYYTSTEAETFSGDATTHWHETRPHTGLVYRSRFRVYRILMGLSRGFSILAHLMNPSHGLGLVKAVIAHRKAK